MKKNEVKVGGVYVAMVSSKLTEVRITAIDERPAYGRIKASTLYRGVNLKTGREVSFRSAQKLRREVGKTQSISSQPPTLESDLKRLAQQGAAGTITAEEQDARWTKRVEEEVKDRGLASSLRGKLEGAPNTAPHVIVEARAGTGKTTTLIEGLKLVRGLPTSITPSPQQKAVWDQMELSRDARSVCFVAFNKSIATELQSRVPQGCEAMTMHSMGYKAVQNAFGRVGVDNDRVQNIISRVLGQDIRDLRRDKFDLIVATEKLVSLCKMNLVNLSDPYLNGYDADSPCPICGGSWSGCECSPESELDRLASHYDIELNGGREEVFDLVPKILEQCKDVNRDRCIDFSDMIWLPVVLNLPVRKYDLLLVDEAQDLNRCQQALAKKAGRRLILCGDPYQAIYGFAGADSESMGRLYTELNYQWTDKEGEAHEGARPHFPGCVKLPLTVTRRCGKAIVKEANKIVPEFEAHESNGEGKVSRAKYTGEVQSCENAANTPCRDRCDTICSACQANEQLYATKVQYGDMLLCRVNAPLVSQCFRFLKAGRKATIQGRDIGTGLVSTIKKMMKGYTRSPYTVKKGAPLAVGDRGVEVEIEGGDLPGAEVPFLVGKLSDWLAAETEKENAKRIPSEMKLIALQDRYDCLICFTEGAETVDQVISKIQSVFTDDKDSPGIRLSSIHKAKGLEAKRVFLLEPKGATVPHPMAKTAWQKEQEMNLRYVAITRAIEELVYVS